MAMPTTTATIIEAKADQSGAAVSAPPGLSSAASSAPADPASMTEREALMLEVRKEVMQAVDAKVSEKMQEVFSKGNQMLKKVEQESQTKNAGILAELEHYKAKQDTLQAEHDKLKVAVQGMVTQLAVLGASFGAIGKATAPTGTTTSASGDNNSSSAASASSLQDSPSESFSAASFAGGPQPAFPELPPFPFPAGPLTTPLTSGATPLSLAEALGSETTSTTTAAVPVSLAGSIPHSTHKIFSFTLRKADGTDLGLNVSHHEHDKVLRVESVRAEGAVEAWNRQCLGSMASDKAVLPGDRIVSVNAVTHDPVAMLEECRDKALLKLTVVRGTEPTPTEAPKSATTLRADASEFVPTGPPAGLEEESAEPAKEESAKDDKESGSAQAASES